MSGDAPPAAGAFCGVDWFDAIDTVAGDSASVCELENGIDKSLSDDILGFLGGNTFFLTGDGDFGTGGGFVPAEVTTLCGEMPKKSRRCISVMQKKLDAYFSFEPEAKVSLR